MTDPYRVVRVHWTDLHSTSLQVRAISMLLIGRFKPPTAPLQPQEIAGRAGGFCLSRFAL